MGVWGHYFLIDLESDLRIFQKVFEIHDLINQLKKFYYLIITALIL